MRTTGLYYLFAIILLAGLVSCDSGSGPDSSIPDQTDGRITIVTDPGKLDDRLTLEDGNIPLDTTGLGKRSGSSAFSLTLIASVVPPTVNGTTVMATSVTWNSSFAYVSYNVAGATYEGAVDVIQVVKKGDIKIKGSIAITGSDINAAYFNNNFVFIAEASDEFDPFGDNLFRSVVERVPATGSEKFNLTGALRTPLKSYAATSIYAENNDVFVTSGDNGYLYKLADTTMAVVDSVYLDHARWVHGDGSYLVVMQGEPGRVTVRDKATLGEIVSYSLPVPSATIAESKSTLQVIGGKALIAAGDGGVKLVSLSSGSLLGEIPRLTGVPGLTDDKTVTNAVSGSGQYVFVSNGEAGVYVYQASLDLSTSGEQQITFAALGHFTFSTSQSVNHVEYDGKYLVVASGLGGIKLVEVTF